jgi:aspartyl/glutamyl-tRNA(Asn/Gln) amidotransferase C subunit
MIEKEQLKEYAHKLMFDMDDAEYDTLQEEFAVIIKQMDIIAEIPNISNVEPMTFPFLLPAERKLREDEVGDYLTVGEVLANTKHQVNDQVKVPKVVE